MKRTVTIDLRILTDGPWEEGDVVTFRLRNGSFTATATYPKSTLEVEVNGEGRGSVELWCNSEGLVETEYVCTLPSKEAFTFVLPPGADAVSVEVLRGLGAMPYTLSSETAFQALIATHAATAAAARAAAAEIYTATLTADAVLVIGAALRALVLIDSTAGDVTATLPPAAEMANRELTLKLIAGDFLGIIGADGSETIDGSLVFNLEMINQTVKLIAVGDAWYIV